VRVSVRSSLGLVDVGIVRRDRALPAQGTQAGRDVARRKFGAAQVACLFALKQIDAGDLGLRVREPALAPRPRWRWRPR